MPNNVRQQLQYVIGGNPEAVDSVRALVPGQLGRYCQYKAPSNDTQVDGQDVDGATKEYRYVRVDSGAMTVLPSRGAVAWWANKALFTVTTSPTVAGGRGRIAGVFVNAPTRGNYTFIQTGGPALVKFQGTPTSGPVGNGQFVIPSQQEGTADSLAAGSSATYPALGTSLTPLDGNNNAVVSLSVPEHV